MAVGEEVDVGEEVGRRLVGPGGHPAPPHQVGDVGLLSVAGHDRRTPLGPVLLPDAGLEPGQLGLDLVAPARRAPGLVAAASLALRVFQLGHA